MTHDSQPSCEPCTSRTEPRRALVHGQQIADAHVPDTFAIAPERWAIRNYRLVTQIELLSPPASTDSESFSLLTANTA
jgi:hypothetical protein